MWIFTKPVTAASLSRYLDLKLDALLVGERDEDLEGGHEGGDLGEAGPGDHAGVEGDGVGVVGALQVRAEAVEGVERRLRELKRWGKYFDPVSQLCCLVVIKIINCRAELDEIHFIIMFSSPSSTATTQAAAAVQHKQEGKLTQCCP